MYSHTYTAHRVPGTFCYVVVEVGGEGEENDAA